MTFRRSVVFGLVLAMLTIVATAWGLQPDKDGYYNTGGGVRTKSVAFLNVRVYSIRHDITLTKTDTRVVAARWIERHVPPSAGLAAESSTPLLKRKILPLLLPGPGRPSDPNRDVARLKREEIEYVLVTGAVADRVRAAAKHYPREVGFYDQLQRQAKRLYYVKPANGLAGPWVAVYRL